MNHIERCYRIVMLRERVEAIEGELSVIAGSAMTEVQRYILERAMKSLATAGLTLLTFPAAEPEDLEMTLTRSIEDARERKRCATIAAFPVIHNNDAG